MPVMRVLRTLRLHWKKSVFFTGAACYGANYAHKKYLEHGLMRRLCTEASAFGQAPQSLATPFYRVTVVLNPAASQGQGRSKYDKYCAPLLHLAGIKVSVVRTESAGQAKDLLQIMQDADAVLVAGGDGTLMEAVTGLLRRPDADHLATTVPVGVLPVGRNNYLARSLFPGVQEELGEVGLMATAAMACVRQLYRPVDVVQVENISHDEELAGKKLYGLREFQLGAFRDAHHRLSKYWYWAGLKKAMAYVFAYTTSAKEILWNCPGNLEYAVPVEEEKPVVEEVPPPAPDPPIRSWWDYIVPRTRPAPSSSSLHSSFPSPAAVRWDAVEQFDGIELCMKSPNIDLQSINPDASARQLKATLGPAEMAFGEFVREGWRRETTGSRPPSAPEEWTTLEAGSFRFFPSNYFEENEKYFYLDNESVELRGALEVSLLPDKFIMFCSEQLQRPVCRQAQGDAENGGSKKWWQRQGSRIANTQQMSPAVNRGLM